MSSENKYCAKCGATLPAGASFCAKCGTPVSLGGTPPPTSPPPYYSRREYRRYEEQEKQEKSEKGEKGRGGGGIVGPIIGGLILVWLGVTFFLQQTRFISSNNWWAFFLAGVGAILILQGLLHYAISRRPFIGSFIGGAILMVIGLSFLSSYNLGDFWPLILVVIGAAIIASAFTARRRTPNPV